MIIPVIYGLVLVLIHYYNDDIDQACSPFRQSLVSFGAGISIAYLFLFLFPELYHNINGNSFVFVAILIGFTLYHVIEKHVYQYKSKKRRLTELKEAHSVSFFIYHFLIGIVIYYFAAGDFVRGLLFFIPIVLHSAVSNISLSEVHVRIKRRMPVKLLLSLPALGGVLFATFFTLSTTTFAIILGLVVGIFLYVVIRDSIPKEREGNIWWFLVGNIVMLLLVFATGLI